MRDEVSATRALIRPSPLIPHPFEDVALAHLLRGGAREVVFGPDVPAADLLMPRERRVGALDGPGGVAARLAHDEDGERLRPARAFDADDRALPDFGLMAERRLDVFGVDVQSGGGDDNVLLAPLEKDVALGVHLAEVARAEPAALARQRLDAAPPVARRDVRSAHQNLPVLVEFDLLSGQSPPDRAAR